MTDRRQRRVCGLALLALALVLAAATGCGGKAKRTSMTTSALTSTSASFGSATAGASGCRFTASSAAADRPNALLFATRYGHLRGARPVLECWHNEQVPGSASDPRTARMQLVPAPGSADDPNRPRSSVMRVELRPFSLPGHPGVADGDVTDTGGYIANRAEIYDRIATGGTPASAWPDPVDSVRWYSWSLYVPPGFATSKEHWLDLVQWKGLRSGSPAVAVGTDGGDLVLDGKTVNVPLSALTPGKWMRLVVGIRFSPVPSAGWVTAIVNGHSVVRHLVRATMNTYFHNGRRVVDPSYFKQGIYRSKGWTVEQVVYFGPTRIGSSRSAVDQP